MLRLVEQPTSEARRLRDASDSERGEETKEEGGKTIPRQLGGWGIQRATQVSLNTLQALGSVSALNLILSATRADRTCDCGLVSGDYLGSQ